MRPTAANFPTCVPSETDASCFQKIAHESVWNRTQSELSMHVEFFDVVRSNGEIMPRYFSRLTARGNFHLRFTLLWKTCSSPRCRRRITLKNYKYTRDVNFEGFINTLHYSTSLNFLNLIRALSFPGNRGGPSITKILFKVFLFVACARTTRVPDCCRKILTQIANRTSLQKFNAVQIYSVFNGFKVNWFQILILGFFFFVFDRSLWQENWNTFSFVGLVFAKEKETQFLRLRWISRHERNFLETR